MQHTMLVNAGVSSSDFAGRLGHKVRAGPGERGW